MSYVVLARKWRPQSFADLVGQEHVARTLGNAIATGRVAHAFLFTGVRGVGKTTSARILAKALNCVRGPTAEPCQTCDICKQITEGSDVDVQEIDGASYNGVDEVRRLQEGLPYRPARDRFKIYIVDEVHMLSTAAWNAFLKTLEEPPPHVKFIFATTEVHKVPVTILSRCQRFDFKLLTAKQIEERLRQVMQAEGFQADDEALRILAREAAGSMRDAMSLLDQVIAWLGGTGEPLDARGVGRVLGVAARAALHELGEALVAGDAGRCLELVADFATQGYPLTNVARDFLAYLRDVVVAKVSPEPARLLELGDADLETLGALAARTTAEDLSRLYLGLSRAFDDLARSGQPRGAFEMTLVRLARRPALQPIDVLVQRLADLEKRLEGGALAGGGGAPSGGGSGGAGASGAGGSGARAPARPPAAGGRVPAAPPLRGAEADAVPAELERDGLASAELGGATPVPSPIVSPIPASPIPASPIASPSPDASPSPIASRIALPIPTPSPIPPSPTPAPLPIPAPSPPRAPVRDSARPNAHGPAPAAAFSFTPPPMPERRVPERPASSAAPSARAPVVKTTILSESALAAWRGILERLAQDKPAFASIYGHAAPLAVDAARIVLGFEPGSFLAAQADNPEALARLRAAARAHFGLPADAAAREPEIELDKSSRHAGVETVAGIMSAEHAARIEAARQRVAGHPLVVAAISELGATLRDIRLPEEPRDGAARSRVPEARDGATRPRNEPALHA